MNDMMTIVSFGVVILVAGAIYYDNIRLRREKDKTDHLWRQDWIRLASLIKAKTVSEFAIRDVLKSPPDPYVADDAPPTPLDAEVDRADMSQFLDFSLTDRKYEDVG